MTWWDGFCWIIYLSNEKKGLWLLKFRLYIEGYTIPFANRVYYTPLWESQTKTARIQWKVIRYNKGVFSWLTCYTPENGGEHIFLTYPRDPDSPCQRMIGVYNHPSKVCRFHYQSQKGNWIPRAIWIPLIFWVVVSNMHPYLGKISHFDTYVSNGMKPPTSFF